MPSWQTTQGTPEENDRCTLYWCGELDLMVASAATNFEQVIMNSFAGSNIGFDPSST